MPIKNVIRLFAKVDESAGLRKQLNNCENVKMVNELLNREGFCFDSFEFEDAVRMMHLQCQTEEDAMFLLEKAVWLRYLLKIKEE